MEKIESENNNRLVRVCTSRLAWLFHIGEPVFSKLVADRFAHIPFSGGVIHCNRLFRDGDAYGQSSCSNAQNRDITTQ